MLDCFLPFVRAGIADQAGTQFDTERLRSFLKVNFGFDIPLYALEQFTQPLTDEGALRYDKIIHRHVCVSNIGRFTPDKEPALEDFEDLRLEQFAVALDLRTPPVSETWTDALVGFLKGLHADTGPKTARIKGTLLADGARAEHYVIGRFIAGSLDDKPIFDKVLSIFKGVLIEEFIAGGVRADSVERVNDMTIFYDTALLMRLLGCSGSLLYEATAELHRYLQEVGCSTEYLHVNEEEVASILATIVGPKDAGYEIYGETGEAIERGEIAVSDLRMLNGMFPEKLAALNIFATKKSVNSIYNPQRFQIDERGFQDALFAFSEKRGRPYRRGNRENDAQALGSVILFRVGHKSRDALKSRAIFITGNKLLAIASRSFLINQRQLGWHDCPPVLHVGQITTIMWLLKHRKLEDKAVSRELLASCYAAYRPEAEWLQKFVEAVGRAKELAVRPHYRTQLCCRPPAESLRTRAMTPGSSPRPEHSRDYCKSRKTEDRSCRPKPDTGQSHWRARG
jgi:hypothetical protein